MPWRIPPTGTAAPVFPATTPTAASPPVELVVLWSSMTHQCSPSEIVVPPADVAVTWHGPMAPVHPRSALVVVLPIRTSRVIAAPPLFVRMFRYRAKSTLPVAGMKIFRCRLRPWRVSACITTSRLPSSRVSGDPVLRSYSWLEPEQVVPWLSCPTHMFGQLSNWSGLLFVISPWSS